MGEACGTPAGSFLAALTLWMETERGPLVHTGPEPVGLLTPGPTVVQSNGNVIAQGGPPAQ